MSHPQVIIAIGNMEIGNRLRNVLNTNGYSVFDICTSGNEAIRRIRTLRPEILIANYELPDITGLNLVQIVLEERLCSAILLTNETQKEYVDSLINSLDVVCLNKPFNKTLLLNVVELLMRSRKKVKKLESELNDLKKSIETKKLVDKAKGILIDKLGLSEPDAHRKIQKQSMDSGVPIKEVAKIIIETMAN